MEKNKWIDEVMKSHQGIQKAEVPAFFTEKLMNRIESEKGSPVQSGAGFGKWALGFTVLLLTLNILVLQKNVRPGEAAKSADMNNEYDHSVIYTY